MRPFNGQTMGVVSAKYPTLLTPANYTFGIWGVIFLSLIGYAVWQLLPAQADNPLPDRVAKMLTLANLATAGWVVAFSYEMIGTSVLLMLVILLALIISYALVREAVLSKAASWLVSMPFALYLSWISVAAVIDFTIGLQQFGLQSTSVIYAYGVLALVVVLTLMVAGNARDLLYPAPVVWALVGIWVARVRDEPNLGWAALGSAVLLALLSFALVKQRDKRQPWEVSAEAAAAETERIRANA